MLLLCSRIVSWTITYKIIWKQKLVLTGREISSPYISCYMQFLSFPWEFEAVPDQQHPNSLFWQKSQLSLCHNDSLVHPEASLHMCHRWDGMRRWSPRCAAWGGQSGKAAIRVCWCRLIVVPRLDCWEGAKWGVLVGPILLLREIDFPEKESWRNTTGSP